MQTDLFKYALRKLNPLTSNYDYYYIDANGVVQSTTTKTYLNYAPEGWEDQSLKWERGTTYYGVFTNYTNPLRFVKDGRKILKTLFYTNGINLQLELLIDKHSNQVATWGYNQYYVGDIDFSRFKDEKDFTQVEIMQQGFMSKLKANEDTKYEVSLNTGVWVKMDGYPLQGLAKWTGVDEESIVDIGSNARIPTMPYVSPNEGYNINLNFQDNSLFVNNYIYFIKNISSTDSQYITVVHNFYINAFVKSSSPFSATFTMQYVFTDKYGVDTIIDVYTAPTALAPGSSQTYLGTLNNVYNLQEQERIALVIRMFVSPGVPLVITHWEADQVTGNSIEINWATSVPETYVKALPALDLGTLLAQKIDANALFSSDVASNNIGYMLTSGDALRNLTGAVIKTSMSDYFRAMNCMYNTALWFDTPNDTLHIDDKGVVFESGIITNIGEVASLQIEPYIPEQFSVVKFGYKPYEYDTINGKEEFNQDTTWNTPLVRVQGTKDFISPYRADRYGIELVRANLGNKSNADSDNDNDLFWLNVDYAAGVQGTIPAGYQGAGQNYYKLYRDPSMSYVQGVEYGLDCYNTEFSPKRRMWAFAKYLRGCLDMYASGNLTFVNQTKTQEGNISVITDDGLKVYDEKANQQISGLSISGYFLPYLLTIEVKIPVNLQEIFDTGMTAFGLIEFTYKGNTYQGYIIEATDSPTYRPKQTFKLLAKFGTNLTNLINGL